MTADRKKQLLQEILAEYDLDTVLDALLEVTDARAIVAYVLRPNPSQPPKPATSHMHPTEGWVSGNWPG
jgi:hypothetical protein